MHIIGGAIVIFSVQLVNGIPIVTKTVTYSDGRTVTSSAPVLKVKNCQLFKFSGYKCAIFSRNLLAIGSLKEVYIFYIKSYDAEPLTSDKICFLREIMKDVRKKFSKKGRWQADVKALAGTEICLWLSVIHKKSQEEKSLRVRMFPSVVQTKDGSSKLFQSSSWINISELP
jgi:RAB protein geranylgeranyltransferase component A